MMDRQVGCRAVQRALTTPTTDRSTTCTSSGTFRSGSARLGLSHSLAPMTRAANYCAADYSRGHVAPPECVTAPSCAGPTNLAYFSSTPASCSVGRGT